MPCLYVATVTTVTTETIIAIITTGTIGTTVTTGTIIATGTIGTIITTITIFIFILRFNQYPVNMVGHDHKGPQFHMLGMVGYLVP